MRHSPASTRRRLLVAAGLLPAAAIAQMPASGFPGRTLRVGTDGDYASLRDASRAARDGDTVEVAAGDYSGDAAVWTQRDLTIRATGGLARLTAAGAHAEGKGIFVIRSNRVRIENIAFVGARVPDRNGAGIRLERGQLEVAHCRFEDNENGILTGNDANAELTVVNSTFLDNGAQDGQAHTIYVGAIRRLEVTGCHLGRGRVGHLLKSRARETTVRYSRITGEEGTASYEVELPSGGRAMLVGNLIQQGRLSQNFVIVSFGAEGYRWPDNELQLWFNTIVNDRPGGGVFVKVKKGAQRVVLANNLLAGPGSMGIDAPLESRGNAEAQRGEFADPVAFDYRLRAKSRLVGRAGFRGGSPDDAVVPEMEYVDEASTRALEGATALTPLSPGAFQRVAP